MSASLNGGDAKHRRAVRLPDGRTARLVFYPRKGRGRAVVQLPSGAYLNVPAADLTTHRPRSR